MALDVAPAAAVPAAAAEWSGWIARALSPLSAAAFFRDHLEREPLHLAGRGSAHYAGLFSLAELEAALFRGGAGLNSGNVMAVRTPPTEEAVNRQAAEVLPVPDGAKENLPAWLRTVYAQGYSIRLMRVESHSAPVMRLAQAARLMFSAETSVNAYLSPPRAQGFNAHYDTHDTFILQIHGEKRWRLHGRWARLPCAQRVGEDAAAQARPHTRELLLRPGDLLYLPRGHAHEAAAADGASLHLTLGLYSQTWGEVFAALAAELTGEHEALRRRVPWRPQGEALEQGAPEAALRAFCELLDAPRLQRLLHSRRRRLLEASAVQAPLFEPLPAPVLLAGTRLERAVPCLVSEEGERLCLSFPGSAIAGPARLGEALRFVAGCGGGFAAAELPGLDEESRRVLLARLLEEGVLRAV